MSDIAKKLDQIQELFQKGSLHLALKKITKLVKNNKYNFLAHNYRGIVLVGLHQTREALVSFKKAIDLNPDFADAYSNMGMAYQQSSNVTQAIKCYQKAIDINGDAPHYRLNLASIYLENDKNHLAIHALTELLERNSSVEHAHQLIAEAYIRQSNLPLAIEHHQKAWNINPVNPMNEYLLGVDFLWSGKMSQAEKHLAEAEKINPQYCEAIHGLVRIKKYLQDDPFVFNLLSLLKNKSLSTKDQIFIHFSLSKIYDDGSDYQRAFDHLAKGNTLMKGQYPFDFKKMDKLFDQITHSYENNSIPPLAINEGIACPIFIIGMPRSGSSLIEQIITGSSLVFGAGEINTLHENFSKIDFTSENLFEQMQLIKKIYEERITHLTDKPYVTDKLLLNFYWLGFIKKIFPACKVIHIQRNPIDVCFSGYQNLFVEGALSFTYDQEDIVRFYQKYEEMMSYWSNKLQDNILQVSYEELVNNPTVESKKIFNFIGIKYEEHFIEIDKNHRPVQTASDTQLRTTINKNSIARWKKYEPFIAPILEAFPGD